MATYDTRHKDTRKLIPFELTDLEGNVEPLTGLAASQIFIHLVDTKDFAITITSTMTAIDNSPLGLVSWRPTVAAVAEVRTWRAEIEIVDGDQRRQTFPVPESEALFIRVLPQIGDGNP